MKEEASEKRVLTRDSMLAFSMQLLPEKALHRAAGQSTAGHSLLQSHDMNWAAGRATESALLVSLAWSLTRA